MRLKIIIYCLLIIFISCERQAEKRKIKLSDKESSALTNEQLSTTIHLDQNERRSIAVLFFENLTGDGNLQWLQKGLTEMLIRALSQYQSLSVLSTDRLFEILDRLDKTQPASEIDMDIAAIVAKEANVEAILTGNIKKKGNSLQINVQLHDSNHGKILQERSVEGPGLEKIFTMVDQLTHSLQNDLYLSLDKKMSDKGIAELSTNSLDAWRHYTAGVDLQNKLLDADALEHFKKAVEIDSNFISAYIRLARAYYSLGHIDSASKLIDNLQILKENATRYDRYQIDFLTAASRDDFDKLIEVSERWLNDFPDSREANYNIASIHFGTHRFDKAIPYYQRVLKIDPAYKLALNQLGYAYANIGDFENAISTIKRYIQTAPDEPNPYDSLGEIYFFLGENDQAEKYFKKAYETNNNFTVSLTHLGKSYFDKGDYARALKTYQKFHDSLPLGFLKSNSYVNMAQSYWRLGKHDRAIQSFDQALTNAIFPYPIVRSLYDLHIEQNDSLAAHQMLQQNYERIKAAFHDNPQQPYLTSLGLLSLLYGIQQEETINLYKNALRSVDNNTHEMQFQFILTLLYLMKNKDIPTDYNIGSDEKMEQLISMLSQIQNLSYTDIWKYFLFVNTFYYQFPEQGVQYYQKLITISQSKTAAMLDVIFRLLLADLYYHSGDVENGRKQFQLVGAPEETLWLISGPFDNKNGFHRHFPPEKELTLNKIYQIDGRKIQWITANDGFNDGYIDLKKNFANANWAVGYGLIYLKTQEKKEVQLRLGVDSAVRVWLNDKEVWKLNRERHAIMDDDVINVTLNKDINKLLIKAGDSTNDWGFYFRITDRNGTGLSDVEFVSAASVH